MAEAGRQSLRKVRPIACVVAAAAIMFIPAVAYARPDVTAGTAPAEVHVDVGPSRDVTAVAWTADGSRVLSGSYDGTVRLWDVPTGRLVRVFRNGLNSSGMRDPVWVATFVNTVGTEIATSAEKSIVVWDAASGRVIRRIGSARFMINLCFSTDGRFAAANTGVIGNTDRRLDVFDVVTGSLAGSLPQEISDAKPLAFSANDHLLAVDRGNGALEVWDIRTGQRIARMEGNTSIVNAARFSSDGHILLFGGDDNTARIWDVTTGATLRKLGPLPKPITTVALNIEGTVAAIGTLGGTVIRWDIETSQTVARPHGKVIRENSLAFSPDGQLLLSGHDHALTLLDAANLRLVKGLGTPDATVSALAMSQDSRMIVAGDHNNDVRVWDTATGRLVETLTGHSGWVMSTAFLPDGKRLVTAGLDGLVRLWDVSTGAVVRDYGGHFGPAFSMVVTGDGSRILTGTGDGFMRLWDTNGGNLIRQFDGGSGFVREVSMSADGSRVASFAGDRLRIWDLQSARPSPVLDANLDGNIWVGKVLTALLSPSGDVLTIDAASTLRLFKRQGSHSATTVTMQDGGKEFIGSEAFSPDGTRLMSGSNDGTARVLDLHNGRLLQTFEAGADVTSVAFPRSGRAIVGGADGGIRIFDTANGELLVTLIATNNGEWVALTPEGFFDGSEARMDQLTISHGLDVYSLGQFYQLLYRPDLVREKLSGDPAGRVRTEAERIGLQAAFSSGLPPAVRLEHPAVTDDGKATISADITDCGGGIGDYEWRVNGATVGVRDTDKGDSTTRAGVIHLTQTFDLPTGRSVITLVAYNGKNMIESRSASVDVDVAGASGPGRLFVLAAGVNDYADTRLHLEYAAPDARAIAMGFEHSKGDMYSDFDKTVLLDRNVTAEALDKAFASLASRVHPNDTFVLFLAGHGKTVDGHYYFVPSEVRYDGDTSIIDEAIGQDRLQRWIARIPAAHSVLIFDTCDSGSTISGAATQQSLQLLSAAAIGKLSQATGRTVIAATSENADALEGYAGHGVLTWSILQAMQSAPTDVEGRIDVTGLIAFVDRLVPEISLTAFHRHQTPQASLIGTDFPLMVRVADLPAVKANIRPRVSQSRYVVLENSTVYSEAGGKGQRFMQLQPGTLVDIERTEAGWALVVRDGKPLGYVTMDALAIIQ